MTILITIILIGLAILWSILFWPVRTTANLLGETQCSNPSGFERKTTPWLRAAMGALFGEPLSKRVKMDRSGTSTTALPLSTGPNRSGRHAATAAPFGLPRNTFLAEPLGDGSADVYSEQLFHGESSRSPFISALVRFGRPVTQNSAASASPFNGQIKTAGETPKGDPFRQPLSSVGKNRPLGPLVLGRISGDAGARLISKTSRSSGTPLGLLLVVSKGVRKV